ncbi:MAG: chemotaxis protein CheD [Pirellulales bacterium]
MLGFGQITIAQGDAMVCTILGSGIGIVIYDSANHLGAVAHIVHATSTGANKELGRTADLAIEEMVRQLKLQGAALNCLEAKIAGGSLMYKDENKEALISATVEEINQQLHTAYVNLQGEDLGGKQGRKLIFQHK